MGPGGFPLGPLNLFFCAINTVQNTIAGKQDKLTFDTTPTENSSNPVTSGGVFSAINNISSKSIVEYECPSEFITTVNYVGGDLSITGTSISESWSMKYYYSDKQTVYDIANEAIIYDPVDGTRKKLLNIKAPAKPDSGTNTTYKYKASINDDSGIRAYLEGLLIEKHTNMPKLVIYNYPYCLDISIVKDDYDKIISIGDLHAIGASGSLGSTTTMTVGSKFLFDYNQNTSDGEVPYIAEKRLPPLSYPMYPRYLPFVGKWDELITFDSANDNFIVNKEFKVVGYMSGSVFEITVEKGTYGTGGYVKWIGTLHNSTSNFFQIHCADNVVTVGVGAYSYSTKPSTAFARVYSMGSINPDDANSGTNNTYVIYV
jgi:hypothetical protein